MGIAILLTPFMLERLGTASFGTWALALTLTVASGYLSLTDLGLQQASVRFLADARRDSDEAGITAIFSTTLAILVSIAAVAAIVVAGLAPVFASLFSVHGPLRHAAIVCFAIIAGQVIFDLPSLAFRAVLESDLRFGAIRTIEVGRSAAFALLTVIVLLAGRGVVAVALSSATAAATALIAYVVAARSSTPQARFRRSTVDRARLGSLLRFSGSLFVLRILSVIYRQMDKVIIGVVLAVTAVASYEIAVRIQAALFLVVGLGGSALLPAASLARLNRPMMRELFLRVTSYSAALFLPVSIAACLLARLLVIGWVGEGQEAAVGATRLFAVWVALGTFDAAGTTMLVSVGRLKPIVVLSILWVSLNLALSIALVHVWGITGVVAGTVISYVPLLVAYTAICLDEFGISARDWFRRVVAPVIPGTVLQIAATLACLPLLNRLPPLVGALVGGAGGVAIAVGVYLLVVGRNERSYLRTIIGSAVRGGRGIPETIPSEG